MIFIKLSLLYGSIQVILAALALVNHPKSAIVDTGANHTIKCSFNHSVNCSWHKNGILVRMGGRYHHLLDDGISTKDCSMKITNFTLFDVAAWQCMASYYGKYDNGTYRETPTLVKTDKIKLESTDSISTRSSPSVVIASVVVVAVIAIAIVGLFLIKWYRSKRATLKVSTSEFQPSVNYFSFDGQSNSIDQSSESIGSFFGTSRGSPSGGSICNVEEGRPNSSHSSEIKKEDAKQI